MPNALTYWAIGARHFLSYVFEHWLWLWWYRYFLSKVNVWNVNCARATAFIFDTRTGVLVKVSKFLRQKMSRPEGNSNPQPSCSCRMLEPIELSGPDICCPMFLNTGSGGIDIFEVKLTFEMLTVRGQQHSFSTHVFLWKCQSLWERKRFDLRGTRTPTFGFMPNALTYWAIRARHLLSHVFEHWIRWYRYAWSKVNIDATRVIRDWLNCIQLTMISCSICTTKHKAHTSTHIW